MLATKTTEGIEVQGESFFVPERSAPQRNVYFFAYRIRILNHSLKTVQLLTRHWVITDGAGVVQEVRGAGVIGAQPTLGPGDSFSYTSACPLGTPVGTMEGSYRMEIESDSFLDVAIPAFTLAAPNSLN
ncbi:MAG: Co2+/Mg2+ efflux protein ApaG [Myxococcota bacterium]|nr:Co2+/Mg2+ efflux protein ApaG [Myxococcota bacterium]